MKTHCLERVLVELELFKNQRRHWLLDLGRADLDVDGLMAVQDYKLEGRSPEEVATMEKAAAYGAHSVFFEAGRNGRPPVVQAFVFVSDGPANDQNFGELHKRIWSWGGVPLLYRKTPGLVQLFRCAHKPDFVSAKGQIVCKPYKILKTAGKISSDPWWDATRLRNGTLWDDPKVSKAMLDSRRAAHKRLLDEVKQLNDDLNVEGLLKRRLRRKMLILSLLIAYLEARGVFLPGYFGQFRLGATKFFQVLADGQSLIKLLADLEERFNGGVFNLDKADRESLRGNTQLAKFARLVEARQERTGQLTLWELYSFKDLPVELISQIYQIFVDDAATSVYTPPFLVRLMLDEALSWERLDRLEARNEIILDPCCGSGVFLVEAYKRLVLHWRSRNHWKRPPKSVLKSLLKRVHGIDMEGGAVELAAFSLYLALCDALEPEAIRASIKLFPPLVGKTLHHSCFFEAKEQSLVRDSVGVLTGNPPFTSNMSTLGAQRSYQRYEAVHGALPDKQLAYLFLNDGMEMVADGGVLSMLQQYNFLYNQQSLSFRRDFIKRWDVREVLDFISVRGLFRRGGADTKVIVVVAEAGSPPVDRRILHATFRRSGRADAEQGFDVDYYDMHWLPRKLILMNDGVWRADLLGGGRVMAYVDRLKVFRTLGEYAEAEKWDFGEGFIEGTRGISRPADHIVGKKLLPSESLTLDGVDASAITKAPRKPIEGPRSAKRFTPPMLLVREHMDLPHTLWRNYYLTYKNQIVGFCSPPSQIADLRTVSRWVTNARKPLQAYVAASSTRLFSRKATAASSHDILALPYPKSATLDISPNEQIIIDDIVDYYRDLIRLGEDAAAMNETGQVALPQFNAIFTRQINAVYKANPLRALHSQEWPGIICQPFVFGDGEIDWGGTEQLKDKLDALLHEQKSPTLSTTRIARIYDGRFIFLLKPDRLRYWLRSVALRDADETLSDLRLQGF